MAARSDYTDLIRGFVVQKLARERGDTETITDEESLIERGIVDSLGIVQLVGHLEGTLALKIPDEEIVPENFDSVASIASYIARLR